KPKPKPKHFRHYGARHNPFKAKAFCFISAQFKKYPIFGLLILLKLSPYVQRLAAFTAMMERVVI
ncbi:MAG: hypothetical protein ACJAUH_002351, partial [Saprospiraceae bacterium]